MSKYVIVWGFETQALGILRLLKNSGVTPILLDKDSTGIAKFSRYSNLAFQCPDYDSHDKLLFFFKDLAIKFQLEDTLIYATDDEQVKFLSVFRNELANSYRIDYTDWENLQKIHYKEQLYKIAFKHSVPYPRTIKFTDFKNNFSFPFIVKPSAKEDFLRVFKKKAIECRDIVEFNKFSSILNQYKINVNNLMLQEIISGDGNTQFSQAGVSKSGEIIFSAFAKRIRQHPLDYGKASTFVAHVPFIEEINTYTSKILKEVNYTGPFEAEYKYNSSTKEYVILDINMRFWGWHYLLSDCVNIPQVLLDNYQISNINKYGGTWMNIITDFPVSVKLIIKGKLSLFRFIKQFFSSKHAVLSLRDPLPFIMHILLIPYLFIKRGV